MHLVQRLPDNPLDIIGDIHGELTALVALLGHLGYDASGRHRADRKLVFVGDLCDRGPDSQGVIELARHLMAQGNAYTILGNHEINLLINDAKDGSGWFFDERFGSDQKNYAPFRRTPPGERAMLRDFLEQLPLALVRDDIRIVHAAWTTPAIDAISSVPLGEVARQFTAWDSIAQCAAEKSGLYKRYLDEKERWAEEIEDELHPPPFLHAIAEYEAARQMVNPIKVLTSGIEQIATTPFFAGNRWRYSDRTKWWDEYDEPIPVIIGHYWRLFEMPQEHDTPRYSRLFSGIAPNAWHGKHKNVFCIDFSVGARWRDRKKKHHPVAHSRYKLAALQWPENRLIFDSGETSPTC